MMVNNENISLDDLEEPKIVTLLEHFQLVKERVAIEYNGDILKKKDYESVTLQENDTIEIIHFVGGG